MFEKTKNKCLRRRRIMFEKTKNILMFEKTKNILMFKKTKNNV